MNEWLFDLPVWAMAPLILAITYLAGGGIFVVTMALAKGERARAFKSVSGSLLSPLGTIFGLLVVFIVVEEWTDLDHARVAVNREAGAIRTVILLAASFPGESETQIRDALRRYIDEVVSTEWPLMAKQSASLKIAPPILAEALRLVLSLTPNSDGQIAARREIVTQLEIAAEARRERIILSHVSINWIKWACLIAQAGIILVAIAVIHVDNRAGAGIAMGIFAAGIAVSVLLIVCHDRPFSGEISVKPDILLEVRPG